MTRRIWPTLKLGEIALIIMGQSPPGETYNTEGVGLPLINGPAEYGPVHPAPVQWTSMPTRLCEKGDILFCVRGNTTGRMNWADQEYCIGRGLAAIRGKKGASDTSFLRYLLEYLKPDLYSIAIAGGSTFPNINAIQLSNREAAIAPLPEQHAIAHILRAVQAARGARHHEVTLERERKAALMAHLFARGTRGEPTKQTPIGEMPASWEVQKLGGHVAIKGGKRLPKGASFADEQTIYPYIRVVDLANGTVKTNDLRFLTLETQRKIAQYIIRGTDVYISIAGTIGLVGTVPAELDGANLTENAARLVIRQPEHLSRDFLTAYLGGQSGQTQIGSLTAKTTQPKLALARIAQIQVSLPGLAEQQQIAGILKACDAKIAALERESALLDELFRALLEELMTGRVSLAGVGEHDG